MLTAGVKIGPVVFHLLADGRIRAIDSDVLHGSNLVGYWSPKPTEDRTPGAVVGWTTGPRWNRQCGQTTIAGLIESANMLVVHAALELLLKV